VGKADSYCKECTVGTTAEPWEAIRTLTIEVEEVVNSRPLTTDDLTNPDSLDVLMTNHLLMMKSSVVIAPPGNF